MEPRHIEKAADDLIQPFIIERSGIRGRLLRLGTPLDTILARGHYPAPVAKLLAELLALATILASTLKYEGSFTLQIKGDGPIRTMVVDVTSDGAIRGYAGYDETALASRRAAHEGGSYEVPDWLGQGHMAFTVDQGPHTERYQGLVELKGKSLTDCMLHYFRQSQQLNAGILVATAHRGPGWRAGALLIEQIPEPGAGARGETAEEDWRRALILMASCTEEEMLDAGLTAERLLYRLFHEDGVRVFRQRPLEVGCRCTRERVERILGSLPRDELESCKVEGEIVMTCEFCNVDFRFDEGALQRIYRGAANG